MVIRHPVHLLFAAIAASGVGACLFAAGGAQGQSAGGRPQYADNGELLVPTGFEKWVFVGSNLGLAYKEELPETTSLEAARADVQVFHNIYIDPEAYEYFVANKLFPDPTILVMDIFGAADRATKDVLSQGVFNGPHAGLQVAVKDSKGPGGSEVPWSYYIFTDRSDPTKVMPQAPAFPKDRCFDCHLEHASLDNVWVQFYPTLRKLTE